VGDLINLNRARKARVRAAAAEQAAANRLAYGRTKAERDAIKAETARLERHLDATRRED
jgi:hypothetical protein